MTKQFLVSIEDLQDLFAAICHARLRKQRDEFEHALETLRKTYVVTLPGQLELTRQEIEEIFLKFEIVGSL